MIIARASRDGLYGFIDRRGRWLIPPSFLAATDFDGAGLAPVSYDYREWILIDCKGKPAIGFSVSATRMLTGSGGLYSFEHNERWGFIGSDGQFRLEPRFSAPSLAAKGSDLMHFLGGQCAVLAPCADLTNSGASHALGLIEESGNWLIEPSSLYLTYGDGSIVMDSRGFNEIGDPPWGFDYRPLGRITGPQLRVPFATADCVRASRGGLIPFGRIKGRLNEIEDYTPPECLSDSNMRWGLLSPTGLLVLPATYDDIKYMCDGLCGVRLFDRWGFVDSKGNQVIKPQFQDVQPFSNGLAGASDELLKWGFVDRKGNWVIRPSFDEIGPFVHIIS